MSKYIKKWVYYCCGWCKKQFTLSKKSIDDSMVSGNIFCCEDCYNNYNIYFKGKEILCKIKNKQEEEYHIETMKEMFIFINELLKKEKYDIVDEFIENFCKEKTCFQYYVSLLTAALWSDGCLKNMDLLRKKAVEAGKKEMPETEALAALKGLL